MNFLLKFQSFCPKHPCIFLCPYELLVKIPEHLPGILQWKHNMEWRGQANYQIRNETRLSWHLGSIAEENEARRQIELPKVICLSRSERISKIQLLDGANSFFL
jgi:hypothetical protein